MNPLVRMGAAALVLGLLSVGTTVAHAQTAPPAAAAKTDGPYFSPSYSFHPAIGTRRVLVAGCYCSDADQTSDFTVVMDGMKHMYGQTNQRPSIANYFFDTSYGAMQLDPDVKDWYALPNPFSYYQNLYDEVGKAQDSSTRAWKQQEANSAVEMDCRNAVSPHASFDDYDFVVLMYNQDSGMHNHASGKFDYLRPWGGHGGWTSPAIHAHEIGHLLGLAHSAVNGKSSVYANEFDNMSGLDMSSQEAWYWGTDFVSGATGYVCNGYSVFLQVNIKCLWKDTEGQKRLPVGFSAYQRMRLGWVHAGMGETDTRAVSGSDPNRTIQLNALENGGVAGMPRLVVIPLENGEFYSVELRVRPSDNWAYDKGLPQDAIVIYRVATPGGFHDPDSGESADAERVAVLTQGQTFNGHNSVTVSVDSNDLSVITVNRPAPKTVVLDMTQEEQRTGLGGAIVTHLLNITGWGFEPGNVATMGRWTLEGTRVVSGFVNANLVQVTVPDLAFRGPGGFVSVVGAFTPYPKTDPRLVYFGPPADQVSARQETADWTTNPQLTVGITDPVQGRVNGTTVSAQGKGKLALVSYKADPVGGGDFGLNPTFAGVVSTDDLSSVTVTMCGRDQVNYVRWAGNGAWDVVRGPVTVLRSGCLQFVADATTSPSVKDLRSAYLAAGRDRIQPTLSATATTSSGPYVEGSVASGDVVVSINAQDPAPASGLTGVWYALDDQKCQPETRATCQLLPWGSTVTIGAEGRHKLFYFTVDYAGNAYKEVFRVNINNTT